MTSAAARITW